MMRRSVGYARAAVCFVLAASLLACNEKIDEPNVSDAGASAVAATADAGGAVLTGDASLPLGPRGSLDAGLSLDASASAETSVPLDAKSDPNTVVTSPSAEIETVVIDTRNISTGIIQLPEPFPVLLFRDGWACYDINFVVKNIEAAKHREQYPASWIHWRREDGKIAVQRSSGWQFLRYLGEYPPQPAGLLLKGAFTHTSSFSVGTTVSIKETVYSFLPEHRFVIAAQAVFSVENASGGSFPPNQQGTYEVDGYTIRLHYDNGESAFTSFVFGTADPGTLYINGVWFSLDG